MYKSPLADALTEHSSFERAWFHTPSHKGRAEMLSVFGDALKLDVTELPDTGSLYDGTGPIAKAEKEASRLFGTAGTFFSAGGNTLAIQAMIKLAAPCGRKIIAGRVIHRSAVNAMILLDLQPIWVWPRADAGSGLPGRIYAQDVEKALAENPHAAAVYLTCPDYYGVMCDIREISKTAKKYNVPVIVDNAHGAHLGFIGQGLHPLSRGAAMSACSAHKTLPVLTGGAWLNVKDEKYVGDARGAMALFGSTSPSYLTMLSLDLCRVWLEKEGRAAFSELERQVDDVKSFAVGRGFGIPKGECDPVRIALNTAQYGIGGNAAAEYMRTCGVEPEYSDDSYVILIPSPFNTEEDFEKLKNSLSSMPNGKVQGREHVLPSPPKAVMSPRETYFSETAVLPLREAVGRVSAEAACPCPPGVPVVMPGEIISSESAEFLNKYNISFIKVVK